MTIRMIAALAIALSAASPILADTVDIEASFKAKPDRRSGGRVKANDSPSSIPVLRFWMQGDVADAWARGFLGKGTTITVIDEFKSNIGTYGNLGDGTERLRHGGWTYKQASLIAPQASMRAHDFTSGDRVRLSRGLNIMNMSYGMFAVDGYDVSQIKWRKQEQSLIGYAWNGDAVLSKAAGNDAVAVGTATSRGSKDYLASALIGAQSVLFVGALEANGSVSNPASLASYSNYAGDDPAVQAQFLTVGVEGSETGLYGTSFAAPIVSGYAAILGSKFKRAKPAQITSQLLDTARTDTIKDYDPSVHGQGEASISRALAPISIY